MKFPIRSLTVAAGAILLIAFLAAAQGPAAHKRMGMYNPATEINIKGTVEDVKQGKAGPMMMGMGTHLIVKIGEETREVMLGPSNFISSKGFSFAPGDSIELTGQKSRWVEWTASLRGKWRRAARR